MHNLTKKLFAGVIMGTMIFFGAVSGTGAEKPVRRVTIFVHGTLFSKDLSYKTCFLTIDELGAQPFELSRRWGSGMITSRSLKALSQKDPIQFPAEHMRYCSWSGAWDFAVREQVARELYEYIKSLCAGGLCEITLITHSHGGNVALMLAAIAEGESDFCPMIDHLILLACPVQPQTSAYVRSPLFKKVLAIHSSGDSIQIADPQGIYDVKKQNPGIRAHELPRLMHAHVKKGGAIFSGRRFSDTRVTHVSIRCAIPYTTSTRGPAHIEFIWPTVLSALPRIIAEAPNAPQNKYGDRRIVV